MNRTFGHVTCGAFARMVAMPAPREDLMRLLVDIDQQLAGLRELLEGLDVQSGTNQTDDGQDSEFQNSLTRETRQQLTVLALVSATLLLPRQWQPHRLWKK